MGSINSYSSIPVNVNVSIWCIFAFCKSPIRVEIWWSGLLYGMSFYMVTGRVAVFHFHIELVKKSINLISKNLSP